ncbi:MAG: 50S ribosomal protein L4 [Chlamydiales bacterium]|nr:50S ribosomal protein L4 [Chlamydiales bacterium]
MATLKKFDLSGNEIGTVQVDDALLDVSANSQMIKDYIVAIRNNARQWSASTKGRSEINRTGKKPHPQKGQGRSRQGCLAAPQYKGGGIVFGPRPKFDQHVRINKKERRAAIRFLIAEKIKENQVQVLSCEAMKEPKTKLLATFFDKSQLGKSRTLVLGESGSALVQESFVKSLRNIPKKEYMLVPQVNGYELARCQKLVVLDSALDELLAMLG